MTKTVTLVLALTQFFFQSCGDSTDPPCSHGQEFCTEPSGRPVCVDLRNNDNHCGECNHSCSEVELCYRSNCVCHPENNLCHGICVDLKTDKQNCGACDNVCDSGLVCYNGECL